MENTDISVYIELNPDGPGDRKAIAIAALNMLLESRQWAIDGVDYRNGKLSFALIPTEEE